LGHSTINPMRDHHQIHQFAWKSRSHVRMCGSDVQMGQGNEVVGWSGTKFWLREANMRERWIVDSWLGRNERGDDGMGRLFMCDSGKLTEIWIESDCEGDDRGIKISNDWCFGDGYPEIVKIIGRVVTNRSMEEMNFMRLSC
jgi:hypothetical protein